MLKEPDLNSILLQHFIYSQAHKFIHKAHKQANLLLVQRDPTFLNGTYQKHKDQFQLLSVLPLIG